MKRNRSGVQFYTERLFVDRLEEPGTERSVNFQRCANYLVGPPIEFPIRLPEFLGVSGVLAFHPPVFAVPSAMLSLSERHCG